MLSDFESAQRPRYPRFLEISSPCSGGDCRRESQVRQLVRELFMRRAPTFLSGSTVGSARK